jgi:cysteine desulfurase
MDCHSTTPVDPRVLKEMLPFFSEKFGNAASRTHAFGSEANQAVEAARSEVAGLIGADPSEIVFTSGATESDNLAIKGVVEFARRKNPHVLSVVTEHKAVLDSLSALERDGQAKVTTLPVRPDGRIDLSEFENALRPETLLVSVMFANNEIGVIQPVAEIGRICHERGVIFHCDAAQAAGKVPVDVDDQKIDLLSLSAHKMYGPKGIGALYVRKRAPRVRLLAQMDGGGHEQGLRSGTLAVPLIVGFGEACRIAGREMPQEAPRIRGLRERLRESLFRRLDHLTLNGSLEHRLPGNLNVSVAYVEGESLILGMGDLAVSSGSACTSAKLEPSYVLHALGVNEALARASVRFGLGRFNTEAEVDRAVELVVRSARRLREISPLYPLAQKAETS